MNDELIEEAQVFAKYAATALLKKRGGAPF